MILRRENVSELTMYDDGSNVHELDLEKSDRHVWLMKSPVVVAKAWTKQTPPPPSYSFSSSVLNSSAKVVHSVDTLHAEPEISLLSFRVSKTLDC